MPSGAKPSLLLKALWRQGHAGVEFDAWLISIGEGDQFDTGGVPEFAVRAPEPGGQAAPA